MILGLIYGAALGDAIGIATENMTTDECHFHYDAENFQFSQIIRDDHRTHWRPGDWTGHFDQMVSYITSHVTLIYSRFAGAVVGFIDCMGGGPG